MSIKRLKALCLFFLLMSNAHAQDLVLTHEKKQRSIEVGKYLILEIKSGLLNRDCPTCYDRIIGKFLRHNTDSIQLQVTRKDIQMTVDCESIGGQTIQYKKLSEAPIQMISKKDIVSIVVGSNTKANHTPLGDGVAAVLGVIGFGHLISAPLGDGNDGLLAVLGATEIALAAVIGSVSRDKSYVLQPRGSSGRDKKIWNLH